VLVVGEGDTGQLGLGPDVMDRSKAARVNLPASVIQICAGGMHSVCLTLSGEVGLFLLFE
jgi:regulator of chromosome condensation